MKTAILSIPVRQRMKSTDQMRTLAGNMNEIDHEMTKGLLSKMGQREARVFRYVSTGAMWNEHQLNCFDRGNGKCKHCGADIDSTDHVLWKCAVINKYRKHKELIGTDPTCFPESIRNGIPCTMDCNLLTNYWGKDFGYEYD